MMQVPLPQQRESSVIGSGGGKPMGYNPSEAQVNLLSAVAFDVGL